MTTVRLARRAALMLALGGALAVPPAAGAATATDYTKIKGRSTARYSVEKKVVRLPAFDGRVLYIEVTKPKGAGRFPVILEASPYHGTLADREGTRILPGPKDESGKPIGLTGYFAPRGYAVVMMDLRGTGRSQGCLDHLGLRDARDLKRVVEWAAASSWSNGKVGMTGHSYVGSTPMVAAAQRPKGLTTIVPSAGLASMYDHQFQGGVPYFLQYVGPIEAYEQLAIERKLPPFSDPSGQTHTGDDFGNSMEETGCGLPNSALIAGEDQLSGRYSAWHEQRDWSDGAAKTDATVFAVHGVNDNAARVTALDWFMDRRRSTDKLWLGQWDHGSGCCPNRRGVQWTAALHAWFDNQLAGRDVSTGPNTEVFMSDGTFEGARAGDRSEILMLDRWRTGTHVETFHATAAGRLASSETTPAGAISFTGSPSGYADPQGTGGATFSTPRLTRDKFVAGRPILKLTASVTAPRVHLIATVYDENAAGARRRIGQFAINPELRDGIANRRPVTPGELYTMRPPAMAMGHRLRAGHKLVLRVTTSDPDKVPTFAADPQVTVAAGGKATALALPVVDAPVVARDTVPLEQSVNVPEGPAQAPVTGSATPTAPAAGTRVAGLDSAFFEFDALARDNARMVAKATYDEPADVDLFLQRRLSDGTWTDDLFAGSSSSLESETLEAGRLMPGRYRIEVNNYTGRPGMPVNLGLTFFNRKGEPGK